MSGQAITLEEALQQLQLLESQIKQYEGLIAEIEARMVQLSSLEDAMRDLRGGSDDVLVPLDPRSLVVARAAVKPLEKVIVHAGLNVFVELPFDKALDMVRDERSRLSKLADTYRSELAKMVQYYEALRTAVEQALAQAQAAREARTGRG